MKRMKLLLDTNALIDFFARRHPYYDDMVKVQVAHIAGDVELWIAPHSLSDASYILRKAVAPSRLQEMMEHALEFLTVSSAGQDATATALAERWKDFEDAFVYQCARRVGADYIITRDVDGFAGSDIPARTAADFLAEVERDHGLSYASLELA